jgi:hypothetical protein
MHRFWGHLFDLTNITSGTSNFDLTSISFPNKRDFLRVKIILPNFLNLVTKFFTFT